MFLQDAKVQNAKKQSSGGLVKQLESRQGVQQQQHTQQNSATSASPAEQAKQRGNAAFAKEDYRQVRIHLYCAPQLPKLSKAVACIGINFPRTEHAHVSFFLPQQGCTASACANPVVPDGVQAHMRAGISPCDKQSAVVGDLIQPISLSTCSAAKHTLTQLNVTALRPNDFQDQHPSIAESLKSLRQGCLCSHRTYKYISSDWTAQVQNHKSTICTCCIQSHQTVQASAKAAYAWANRHALACLTLLSCSEGLAWLCGLVPSLTKLGAKRDTVVLG